MKSRRRVNSTVRQLLCIGKGMSPNALNIALALLQFVTVVALIFYVWKTWQTANATTRSAENSAATLKQMQEIREAENAPNVVAFFDVDRENDFLYLVVRNIGKSIAKSVKL